MTKYFLGTLHSSPTEHRYRLFAKVDERHYWVMEWKTDQQLTTTICDWHCGLLNESISFDGLKEITLEEIRKQFASFAYYLDRSINGFKSYVAWIAPDPHTREIIWK